jgi:hypothetical protein
MFCIGRTAALAAFSGIVLPAFAATTSDSRITVSGGPIAAETFVFARVYGDWFVAARDAHAFLTLVTTTGAHQAQAVIELDGKSERQEIEAGEKDLTFLLHLRTPYNQTVQLKGFGRGRGYFDPDGRPQHRGRHIGHGNARRERACEDRRHTQDPSRRGKRAGGRRFGDCDPVVHDRLAGAEWRSATECEIKFDSHAREALRNALKPLEPGWAATGNRPRAEDGPALFDSAPVGEGGVPA